MKRNRIEALITLANALPYPFDIDYPKNLFEAEYSEKSGIRPPPVRHNPLNPPTVSELRFEEAKRRKITLGGKSLSFKFLKLFLDQFPIPEHPGLYEWLGVTVNEQNSEELYRRCLRLEKVVSQLKIYGRYNLARSDDFKLTKTPAPAKYDRWPRWRTGKIVDFPELLKITNAWLEVERGVLTIQIAPWLKELEGLPVNKIMECPICATLFYRSRLDKSACSAQCGNTLRVRRNRR
jgi:hypothetical protein